MTPRRDAPGCQVTTYHRAHDKTEATHCGQPLAPGSRFCAKHTADAVRLGGRWEA